MKFDEHGLIPTITQDAATSEVLTLAYMNEESLRRTMESGETWFWSRSRNELWHKGAISGNVQALADVVVDCDEDALLIRVTPAGPACHKGETSCFHNYLLRDPNKRIATPFSKALTELYDVIESRKRELPEGSYTTSLFQQGIDQILKKVGEEASETIIAAKNQDDKQFVSEVSDLMYHLLVLLVARGVTLDEIGFELSRRALERLSTDDQQR